VKIARPPTPLNVCSETSSFAVIVCPNCIVLLLD
jgi:hypothetical protein